MCCVRNARNINVFVRVPGREESGSRPGGSVTRVSDKLFMCQMFMCLFRPLGMVEELKVFLNFPVGGSQSQEFQKKTNPKGQLIGRPAWFQGELKGTNPMGQTEPNSQFFADFRWFLQIFAFPGNYSTSGAQIFAGNRRFSQKTAGNRRFSQKPVCPI